ncbi:hypothetical protein LPC08_06595 [Roseomonas sp. OT10]|uniref:hypothetical protein n=1 Tax=Roseomonas cutis TaxID=2897332 RepID=UPI001E5C92FC|nr:hypothetical protein [Roseomonas sp. OT10]UFN50288.1 hypothetical protein LPC08_06595 [Roseomonas sp. OT10]
MSTIAAAPTVAEVADEAAADAWLRLPALLGGEAAGWSVPLLAEQRRTFDPGFNPALAEWRIARFLALRDGRPVGRIAAALPRDGSTGGVGHCGFLALEHDPAVLAALLDAASARLRGWGASRLRGPLSWSINHEVGAQVAGFGAPPMLRMPRNPGWLPPMLEAAGLRPEKDVLACTLDLAGERHSARFAPLLARWPGRDGLRVRPLRRRRLATEVALLRDLYNDAWAGNWGAQPVSAAEAGVMRRLLAPLLLAGRVLFAEWRGEAIGLCAVVPNIEEATARLDGRLAPFGWARMLPALAGRTTSGRLPLLGVRRAFRGGAVSAMAVGAMLSGAIALARRRGWARLEVSWILEDNAAMLAAMARLPAPETGRWRIYGAALA